MDLVKYELDITLMPLTEPKKLSSSATNQDILKTVNEFINVGQNVVSQATNFVRKSKDAGQSNGDDPKFFNG